MTCSCACVCLLSKACDHKCGPWNEEILRSVCGAEPSLLLLISCVSCFTPLLRIRIKSDKDAALPHACMQRVKCLQVPNAPTAPEAYLFLVKNAQSFVPQVCTKTGSKLPSPGLSKCRVMPFYVLCGSHKRAGNVCILSKHSRSTLPTPRHWRCLSFYSFVHSTVFLTLAFRVTTRRAAAVATICDPPA